MYAILDIETTGGKYNEEGITEIAIYKYDGHTVVDQLITLINPEKEIQPFVVRLTGINNNMLRNAPKFYEVAKRIIEITEDCVIVAHNANFDYRILKTEFDRLGYKFERKTLCTVQLSKKLIPGLSSYSLGKLCKKLTIPVSNRHRAEGDALATVKLFKLLIDKDIDKTIIKTQIKKPKEIRLSDKFQSILDNLPSSTGIFYVHNSDHEIIYLGKGKNLKRIVNKLFLKTSKRAKLLQEVLTSVTYEETGNELINKLKFHQEAEIHRPKFNYYRSKKFPKLNFSNANLVIVDKGRHASEKSIILIENDELLGFCFADLEYQINNVEILKSLLTPIADNSQNRAIVKNHLKRNKVERIIKF